MALSVQCMSKTETKSWHDAHFGVVSDVAIMTNARATFDVKVVSTVILRNLPFWWRKYMAGVGGGGWGVGVGVVVVVVGRGGGTTLTYDFNVSICVVNFVGRGLLAWPWQNTTHWNYMSSFWRNFHHWLHWKLSFWQLSVQPVIKISSKWRHFRFSEGTTLPYRSITWHLMAWRRKEPGHRQSWFWYSFFLSFSASHIGGSIVSLSSSVDFKLLTNISETGQYIATFPRKLIGV